MSIEPMNTEELVRVTLLRILGEIAPEADTSRIRSDQNLREQLDIDSMDFLNVVTALHKELGVDVPEADYGKLATLDRAIDYLAGIVRRRATGGEPP